MHYGGIANKEDNHVCTISNYVLDLSLKNLKLTERDNISGFPTLDLIKSFSHHHPSSCLSQTPGRY